MFCENCGTKNSGSNKFCEKCGKELKKETGKKFDIKSFDYKGFYEKNKIACLAAAGVVVVAIILLVAFGGNSPEKVTKKFFNALQDGDAGTIADVIDFEKYEDKYDLDEDDIDEFAEKLVDEFDVDDFDFEITSSKISGKKAKVKVKVEADDETEKLTVVLVKNGSKWKIDPVKTFGSF